MVVSFASVTHLTSGHVIATATVVDVSVVAIVVVVVVAADI